VLGANPVTVILLALSSGAFQVSKRRFELVVNELEPLAKVTVRTDAPAACASCGENRAASTRRLAKRITDAVIESFVRWPFAIVSIT
jgi:hypothetical protein